MNVARSAMAPDTMVQPAPANVHPKNHDALA